LNILLAYSIVISSLIILETPNHDFRPNKQKNSPKRLTFRPFVSVTFYKKKRKRSKNRKTQDPVNPKKWLDANINFPKGQKVVELLDRETISNKDQPNSNTQEK
jgi:hypothetical protein